MSATELLAAFRSRRLSPVEALAGFRERAEARADLGAFTATRWDDALVEARTHERAYLRGDAAPLAGLPFAAKDLLDAAGLPTAYGSAMFAGRVPGLDAAAVAAARRAGAVLVGKTVTHEFAWGITSINPTGTCRNPWDRERIAGGSSGGAAVAVADRQVPLSIGSDTAGSVRIPAAFCGVTGFKPTHGRIPTAGTWPLAPTFDTVGVLARTVADARLLYDVLDPHPAPAVDIGGMRVAVPTVPDALPAPVAGAIAAAREVLAAGGAKVHAADLMPAAPAVAAFRVLQGAEALAVHRERGLWPARRNAYGADVRSRLEAAERLTAADVAAAGDERERLRRAAAQRFADVDAVLSPVTACAPPRFADLAADPAADLALREAVLPHTVPQSLLGLPACAIPAGVDAEGLPVGLQVCAAAGGDGVVLAVADCLESRFRSSGL